MRNTIAGHWVIYASYSGDAFRTNNRNHFDPSHPLDIGHPQACGTRKAWTLMGHFCHFNGFVEGKNPQETIDCPTKNRSFPVSCPLNQAIGHWEKPVDFPVDVP